MASNNSGKIVIWDVLTYKDYWFCKIHKKKFTPGHACSLCYDDLYFENAELETENQKWKKKFQKAQWDNDGRQQEIENLNQENQKLKDKFQCEHKDCKQELIITCHDHIGDYPSVCFDCDTILVCPHCSKKDKAEQVTKE